MEGNNTREKVCALKGRIKRSGAIQSGIEELKDILADDCAELDKAQVS